MTIERPMFPPRAESVDSFLPQPAIRQPESQTLTSESPTPLEALDLAQLRFVRCLVRYGATLDEAATVVASELERFRKAAEKKRRRRFELVGQHLVSAVV
jgi:hypothetical protein